MCAVCRKNVLQCYKSKTSSCEYLTVSGQIHISHIQISIGNKLILLLFVVVVVAEPVQPLEKKSAAVPLQHTEWIWLEPQLQ